MRNLGASPRNVESLVEKISLEKLAKGRKRGTRDERSHNRKGQQGDWRNHLNQDHLQFLEEQFPGIVAKLGYDVKT